MKSPKIYIICGVHNNLDYTKTFLKSIFKTDYPNKEIIIVNDGSTDGTNEYIQEKYPLCTILNGDGDLWWTGSMAMGVNYVLKKSSVSDYVLTINNDCIVTSNYLSTLKDFIETRKNTIVGSLAVDQNTGKVVDAGVKIDWKRCLFLPIKLAQNNCVEGFRSVDVLSTKGTLYPIKVFKQVGNFDVKNFPHYLSDYEFAYRAKINGYSLYINYQAIVKNDEKRTGIGLSTSKIITISELATLFFSRKSKNNIADQIKFFVKYQPNKYKLFLVKNILLRSLYFVSLTWPFYPLRKLIVKDEK